MELLSRLIGFGLAGPRLSVALSDGLACWFANPTPPLSAPPLFFRLVKGLAWVGLG